MHNTTGLLTGALLRGWKTLSNKPFAFVAALLHCFQVPAGSAQAKQVVLVNNWHRLSRRSDWESNPSPGGDVSVCVRDGTCSPCRGPGNLSKELFCFLPSRLCFKLCAEVPWSGGDGVSLSQIRPWEKSQWDGSALGRGVPRQTASLSSQILRQTWAWDDHSCFLLFKQQPHVEIPPIKSRRCFSRQRDKDPFWTWNFLSYLGLLQS